MGVVDAAQLHMIDSNSQPRGADHYLAAHLPQLLVHPTCDENGGAVEAELTKIEECSAPRLSFFFRSEVQEVLGSDVPMYPALVVNCFQSDQEVSAQM